jgi:hypothetical protein
VFAAVRMMVLMAVLSAVLSAVRTAGRAGAGIAPTWPARGTLAA